MGSQQTQFVRMDYISDLEKLRTLVELSLDVGVLIAGAEARPLVWLFSLTSSKRRALNL